MRGTLVFTDKIPLLVPTGVDMQKWAVVACDQFNADPKYWASLDKLVGVAPSTLRLMCPEISLKDFTKERSADIAHTMVQYIKAGIFEEIHGFVLTERTFPSGKKRVGLVTVIDVEAYDFNGQRSPIRPTEDTILARVPVRVQIRRGATLELSHTLMLIDDERREIIESVYAERGKLRKLYDFELNAGGGHITGYEVKETKSVMDSMLALLDKRRQISKYGSDEGLLLAVGDGNHSLATAKVYWEELKSRLTPEERETHPARFFMCEVNNIYDKDMEFSPIHRLVKPKQGKGFIADFSAQGMDAGTAIKTIQLALDAEVAVGNIEVEYVHGDGHLKDAVNSTGGMGLLMPRFPKEELFRYVIKNGSLPKKAFSIGNAEEKRYYLECKRIK